MSAEILDKVYAEMQAGQVAKPLARMHGWLRDQRRFLTPAQWFEVRQETSRHPLCELLRTDPLIGRARAKPRGYAGDAVMMDLIYRMSHNAPGPADTSAAELHAFAVGIATFRAARFRRARFRTLLDETARRTPGLRVASVGAGHLREAEDSRALRDGMLGRYLAIDQDEQSLAVAQRDYGAYGVVTTPGHVREIITAGALPEKADLVHAGGLYDYLTDRAAIPLTRALIASLHPGGTLVVANIVPTCPDAGYMEAVMDWPLEHRDEQDMRRLLCEVPDKRLNTVVLHRDPDDVMTFMTVTVR